MKTLILILAFAPLTFGQAARSVAVPRAAPPTINYYISTGGSNSNPCTSGSKCLTLAHALTLIPQVLDANYIINVADGTYAESLDLVGFLGTGGLQGIYQTSLKILGNTTTPANVVFTGTSQCANLSDTTFQSGACIGGTGRILLAGLTISSAQRQGLSCTSGYVDLNKVVITMTGSAALDIVGALFYDCAWTISGNVTISGFDGVDVLGGVGLYAAHRSEGQLIAGTLTITGPGGATTGTVGFNLEYGAWFAQGDLSAVNVVISGVQIGILVNSNGSYESFVHGSLSITNGSTTPATSYGIETNGGGTIDISGPLTIDHYTTCAQANMTSGISQGPSATYTRTLTNCGTSGSANGGQIVFF